MNMSVRSVTVMVALVGSLGLSACAGEPAEDAAAPEPAGSTDASAADPDVAVLRGTWRFEPDRSAPATTVVIDDHGGARVDATERTRPWDGGVSVAEDGTYIVELHSTDTEKSAIWLLTLSPTDDADSMDAMTGEGDQGEFVRVE